MTRKEAQIRNHNIMRLKGMWASARNIMDHDISPTVMDAIDRQLIRMGALTIKQSDAKRRKELGI